MIAMSKTKIYAISVNFSLPVKFNRGVVDFCFRWEKQKISPGKLDLSGVGMYVERRGEKRRFFSMRIGSVILQFDAVFY